MVENALENPDIATPLKKSTGEGVTQNMGVVSSLKCNTTR